MYLKNIWRKSDQLIDQLTVLKWFQLNATRMFFDLWNKIMPLKKMLKKWPTVTELDIEWNSNYVAYFIIFHAKKTASKGFMSTLQATHLHTHLSIKTRFEGLLGSSYREITRITLKSGRVNRHMESLFPHPTWAWLVTLFLSLSVCVLKNIVKLSSTSFFDSGSQMIYLRK